MDEKSATLSTPENRLRRGKVKPLEGSHEHLVCGAYGGWKYEYVHQLRCLIDEQDFGTDIHEFTSGSTNDSLRITKTKTLPEFLRDRLSAWLRLSNGAPEAPRDAPPERSSVRWVHVPVNNMIWVPEVLRAAADEVWACFGRFGGAPFASLRLGGTPKHSEARLGACMIHESNVCRVTCQRAAKREPPPLDQRDSQPAWRDAGILICKYSACLNLYCLIYSFSSRCHTYIGTELRSSNCVTESFETEETLRSNNRSCPAKVAILPGIYWKHKLHWSEIPSIT